MGRGANRHGDFRNRCRIFLDKPWCNEYRTMVRLHSHHGPFPFTPWCDTIHTMVRFLSYYGVRTKFPRRFGELFAAFPKIPTALFRTSFNTSIRRVRAESCCRGHIPHQPRQCSCLTVSQAGMTGDYLQRLMRTLGQTCRNRPMEKQKSLSPGLWALMASTSAPSR